MELRGNRWTNDLAIEKIGDKRIRSLELFDTRIDDDFLVKAAEKGSLTSVHIESE